MKDNIFGSELVTQITVVQYFFQNIDSMCATCDDTFKQDCKHTSQSVYITWF